MAEDAMTGYNFQEVAGLGAEVLKVAKNTQKAVQDCLDNDIVEPMSKLWYAPEAKEFFTKFQATVEKSGEEMQKAFNTFNTNVSGAQDAWSTKTGGGQKGNVTEISGLPLKVNVGAFKDSDGGNIVLYEKQAISFADSLDGVQKQLSAKIAEQRQDLSKAVTSFLGHDQGEAVNKCFDSVLVAVGSIFTYLAVGENSLKGQIKEAAESYKKMAEEIKSGMESAAGGSN